MCTWKECFEQLSIAQSEALEKVKHAQTEDDDKDAVRIIKNSLDEMSRFFNTYESCGFPNREKKMPDT